MSLKYKWMKVARFLAQAMAAHQFSPLEHSIIWTVFDQTYGEFGREQAEIPRSHFAKATGATKRNISTYLGRLVDNNVLILHEGRTNKRARTYGINTKIDTWKVEKRGVVFEDRYPGLEVSHTTPQRENLEVSQATPPEVSCTNPPEVSCTTPPEVSQATPQAVREASPGKGSQTAEDLIRQEDYKTTPKSPSRKDSRSKPSLAMEIYVRIGKKYFAMNGPPPVKQISCKKYEDHIVDDPEFGREAFEEAWARMERWEEQAGRKTFKPWSILESAQDFYDNGFVPGGDKDDDDLPPYIDQIYNPNEHLEPG